MDTLLLWLIILILLATAFSTLSRTPQPPQIIYVQAEAPARSDVGCLSWIVIGLLLLKLLGLM